MSGSTMTTRPDGTRTWLNAAGKLHRQDGPAIEYPDGERHWFRDGQPHREGGPAIERPDGSREWFLNGQSHRADGPAIESADGTRTWCRHGELHREDGPAIERPDGTSEWYVNDARAPAKTAPALTPLDVGATSAAPVAVEREPGAPSIEL